MNYRITRLLVLLLLFFTGCNEKHSSHSGENEHKEQMEKKIYTCPMHPKIIRDKPGMCPICGMDLVEKIEIGENIQDKDLLLLLKPTNQFVLSRVNTITLREKTVQLEFPAMGSIAYDTRFINTVSARVSGRIEKLYVKYKFRHIRKGEKLMDIYSEELTTAQENYLYLIKNDSANKTLIAAAENKLLLLGLTQNQIEELRTRGKSVPAITVYSPYNGHLHDVSSMNSDNNTMKNAKTKPQELLIKEGMYVEKGQTVFNIYNTDKVWAVLNIYAEGQSVLKTGQKVQLHIDGADKRMIEAKVDFIEPVVDPRQKTVSIRVYLDNSAGDLKPGAIVKAGVITENKKGNYLPPGAILNLGRSNIVFVQHNKVFSATSVKLGIRTEEWVEIISGIGNKADVAENAQLLMDSEGFIKTDKQ